MDRIPWLTVRIPNALGLGKEIFPEGYPFKKPDPTHMESASSTQADVEQITHPRRHHG